MSDDTGYQSVEAHPMIYTELFKPVAYKDESGKEGKLRYKAAFILDPESADFKAIKKLASRVAKEKFGTLERTEDEPKLKWPWIKVDNYIVKRNRKKPGSGDRLAWAAGKIMLQTMTGEDIAPALGVLEAGAIIDLDGEVLRAKHKGKFYSGVNAYFGVTVKAFAGGNDGTCAYLNMVLTTNKGEKRGGGQRSVKEAFSKYVGKHSAEDPTDGIDDEDDY